MYIMSKNQKEEYLCLDKDTFLLLWNKCFKLSPWIVKVSYLFGRLNLPWWNLVAKVKMADLSRLKQCVFVGGGRLATAFIWNDYVLLHRYALMWHYILLWDCVWYLYLFITLTCYPSHSAKRLWYILLLIVYSHLLWLDILSSAVQVVLI